MQTLLNRLTLIALLVAPAAWAVAPEDVLAPEIAFRYQARVINSTLEIEWIIEPEHYLYKKQFGFKSLSDGVSLGIPVFPEGTVYTDEFFGESVIYRGQTLISMPLIGDLSEHASLDIELKLQGCADIGLCYPPQTWNTTVPVAATASGSERARNLLDLLGSSSPGPGGEDFLPPEEAFRLTVTTTDPYSLSAYWQIEDGYYLYKEKLSFRTESDVVQLGSPRLPEAIRNYDEYFGDSEVYYTELEVMLPLSRVGPEAATFDLVVGYQGCAVDGICYPPIERILTVPLPAASSYDQPREIGAGSGGKISEQDRLARIIRDGNLLLVLATFYLGGLLLSFTPCVLPMIPILSGIIAGQGPELSTRRAFLLSLTYVLGMAVTYTVAGAAFAAAGQQAQAVFQKPWLIVLFAALFVALALSMFGLYALQLPASMQTRLTNLSNRQSAGTYTGTAVMGVLSALVVTACVAPPLVAALTVIGQAGDVARGGSALFAMSMGMGTPLLIIGTSAGTLIPKAGPWMDGIKAAFGVMLLGVAIWMLDRILPGAVILTLWAVLVFLSGVFLGALDPLTQSSDGWRRLGKGLGLLFMAYAVMMLVGAASGSHDPLQPLKGAIGQQTTMAYAVVEFERIKTVADLDDRVAVANENGKTVMLDFYADWCVSCKEMEKYTFADPRVIKALSGTVLLQADVTANDEADQTLLRHMGIYGPPTIAFFGLDGKEAAGYRVVGFMPADEFHLHINDAFGL